MPAALPLLEIGVLLVALLAIALAQQINNIMRAVGDLVRGIWLVGETIADGVDAVARGIAYVLGKAEAGVDAAIGASWHLLARYLDRLWGQLERAAIGYLQLAQLVARLVYSHSGLRSLVHRLEQAWHGIEHGIRTLERKFHGIDARVRDLTRDITKGIGHDLRIGLRDLKARVRGVEHTIDVTIPRAIDHAEGRITSLRDFIKAIPGTSYLEWVGGIVAAGLAAIGMSWIVCRNRDGVNGRKGCDLWDDIGGVLLAAGVFGAALDFRDIVEAAVEVETLGAEAITALASLADDGIDEAAQVIADAANAIAA